MELGDELAISLSINEWNQILAILGEAPYRAVAPLIAKIQSQSASREVAKPVNGPQPTPEGASKLNRAASASA